MYYGSHQLIAVVVVFNSYFNLSDLFYCFIMMIVKNSVVKLIDFDYLDFGFANYFDFTVIKKVGLLMVGCNLLVGLVDFC